MPDSTSFIWGRRRVPYSLERTEQSRLRITVTPSCEVRVVAPDKADEEEIRKRVRRRGHWIVKQIEDFEQFRPRTPPRQFVSGETHLLKGTQYRLRVVEKPSSNIFIRHDRIILETPHGNSWPHKAALLKHLYSLEAHREFPARLALALPTFANDGIHRPHLIIRPMVKRWGSFTPKGSLILNLDLIRAPTYCLDYVIFHELAHALEPNHGRRWKQLMDRTMPDWRERKIWLERCLL